MRAKAAREAALRALWQVLIEYYSTQRGAESRDTARPADSGHIFETLHPDDGYWFNRAIMYTASDPAGATVLSVLEVVET